MVSTWSSGAPSQPMASSYEWNESSGAPSQPMASSYERNERGDTGFTFVDFLPGVLQAGGIFTPAVYETFRTLVDRANDWLRQNNQWKVVTCESVEFKSSNGNYTDSSQMMYTEPHDRIIYYVRGLRLWITERDEKIEREQQIGYVNLVPNQTEIGGFFSVGKFETLDAVIENFNSLLHSNPIPGRVMNIESQEIMASNHFDPDRSNWQERSDFMKQFVIILRIFYEVMAGNPEEIGIMDFVPDPISSGGIFSLPQYEPFTNVISKASIWCSQQPHIRFCNAQSIEMKIKRGSGINTQRTTYTEHGNRLTYYVRILRIAYTKPPANGYLPYEAQSTIRQLTCKTFTPVQIGSSIFMPTYENLYQTVQRVYAWVKATGARVISAETTSIKIWNGFGMQNGPDASVAYNSTDKNEFWIYVIRLYMDGVYREPPPEVLPPIPTYETGCCVLL